MNMPYSIRCSLLQIPLLVWKLKGEPNELHLFLFSRCPQSLPKKSGDELRRSTDFLGHFLTGSPCNASVQHVSRHQGQRNACDQLVQRSSKSHGCEQIQNLRLHDIENGFQNQDPPSQVRLRYHLLYWFEPKAKKCCPFKTTASFFRKKQKKRLAPLL